MQYQVVPSGKDVNAMICIQETDAEEITARYTDEEIEDAIASSRLSQIPTERPQS